MRKISYKQAMVLDYISWHIDEYKYSPTYQEIANELGFQKHSVYRMVMLLEEKGYIKTENGKARTITLVGDENDSK